MSIPNSAPRFESSIPEHLLVGLSPKDKYIMDQMSIMSQQNSWQVAKLEDLDARVAYANSKTSKAIQDIQSLQNIHRELKEKQEQDKERQVHIDQIVSAKKFAEKIAFSKVFWTCSFLILVAITKTYTLDFFVDIFK